MNWNLMQKFVKLLKAEDFQAGVGDIEKFLYFNLLASAWDPKRRFDQSD